MPIYPPRNHYIIVVGDNVWRCTAKHERKEGAWDMTVIDIRLKFGQFNWYWRIK